MTESLDIPSLQKAIRDLFGCESTFVEQSALQDTMPSGLGSYTLHWEFTVGTFDLRGHPTAKRAYAWSKEIPGSSKRRYWAVLHEGKVDSPLNAVRAAIVAQARETGPR